MSPNLEPEKEKRPGWGGVRPNSGRKPKAITELKSSLLAEPVTVGEKVTAADYAFRLLVEVMGDEANDVELRLDCAREVLNRAWGKPRQAVEVTGAEGREFGRVVIYLPDNGRDRPYEPGPLGSH